MGPQSRPLTVPKATMGFYWSLAGKNWLATFPCFSRKIESGGVLSGGTYASLRPFPPRRTRIVPHFLVAPGRLSSTFGFAPCFQAHDTGLLFIKAWTSVWGSSSGKDGNWCCRPLASKWSKAPGNGGGEKAWFFIVEKKPEGFWVESRVVSLTGMHFSLGRN